MPAAPIFGLPTTLLSRMAFLQIDAVLNETHRFENKVTEHPVEDGSPRTDHIVNLPFKLEMEGRITDTPSTILASIGSGAAGLIARDVGIDPAAAAGAGSLLGATLPGRAKAAFQELVFLYQTREVFDVLTGLSEYTNMVFTSLEFPRQASDGRSIRFRARLQEIIVVGAEVISNAARIAEELVNTGLEPNNAGQQPLELDAGVV